MPPDPRHRWLDRFGAVGSLVCAARRAFQLEQRLVCFYCIAIGNMPGEVNVIARKLNKDFFYPAFTTKYAIFAGDHDRMRVRVLRQ